MPETITYHMVLFYRGWSIPCPEYSQKPLRTFSDILNLQTQEISLSISIVYERKCRVD